MSNFEREVISFLLEVDFLDRTTPVNLSEIENAVGKLIQQYKNDLRDRVASLALDFCAEKLDLNLIHSEVNKGL